MVIFQSLALAALILCVRGWIRRHAAACYGLAALMAAGTVVLAWSEWEARLPAWTGFVLPVFTQGGLAGALFIAVMFAAAMPNGSPFMRAVMPIRGELSIIASILTLGHNIAFGKIYFVRLFSGASMPGNVLAAAICSLIMMAVMLPLFVTSFKAVRRSMDPRTWKRLQRLAYLFYALMYVHVMLLNLPSARSGGSARVNVIAYSAIFLSYGYMRIRKAAVRAKKTALARSLPVAAGIIVVGLSMLMWPFSSAPASAGARRYADGTFKGAGMGYDGRMTVSVEIQEGAITDIRVTAAVDEDPYFSDAVSGVIPAVLEAQSADVDAVSGATYSSNGLKDAIAEALSSAEEENR